jgi:hypothetical protein
MENRTKPSPSPRPLPRGEGEPANASSRFGECRLRSHAPKLGATAARPSPTRPNALAHSALPDEPSGSPSPLGRGRGEGEGISLSFTAFFSAVGSGLNSGGEKFSKRQFLGSFEVRTEGFPCPPVGKWFDGRFHKMLTCQFGPCCVGECVGFFAIFGGVNGRDGKSSNPFPLTPPSP